jgi:hypothetical protein
MSETDAVAPSRFFAHTVKDNFLPPELVRALLEYVEYSRDRFKPTTVQQPEGTRVDRAWRISMGLEDLGSCFEPLEQRLRSAERVLRADLGMGPYGFHDVELQIAAHNEGGFFRRHSDTYKGWGIDRVISAVYYFHRQPRAFSGGTLRLYPLTGPGHVEVEPIHNSLVVFPSFVEHEVMPVSCPSGQFMDSRFALNCWFRKTPKQAN